MSTSNGPILVHEIATPGRAALRVRMAEHPGTGYPDGGWWPHSSDLAVELADLVDHFPPRSDRIVRVLISPPDWDPAPRRVAVARGAGNAHSATDLLEEVTDHPDTDPMDHWTDDVGSWWGSDRVAPSFRVGGQPWLT